MERGYTLKGLDRITYNLITNDLVHIIMRGSTVPVTTLATAHGQFLNLFRHYVGLLWTSHQPVAKASTYRGKHNRARTNIHALSEIGTHDLIV
jgi:hypothetical protein